MFKAYAQKFRKPLPDENDSADELETLETQDGSITRKLPESCVITRNTFTSKAHNANSPPRSKAQAKGRNSPNPLQIRSQSQDHKGDGYSSVTKQQASQLQGQHHPDLPMVNKENPNRAREYSFNPKGPDYVDISSQYTDLSNKIYNEKFSSNNQDIVVTRVTQPGNITEAKAPTGKNHRNLNQFLEDQKQHLNRIEAKKKKIADEQISKEKKEEGTYKPEICQKSVKILEKKKQQEKGPAYQRLYNSSKKAGNTTVNDMPESGNFAVNMVPDGEGQGQTLQRKNSKSAGKFKPEIQKKSKVIKREEKVDNLLYNDALRRQNKFSEAGNGKPKTKSSSVTMSSTSKKAIATRFIKEFDIVIEDFLELGKDQKLNYIQLNELLRRLCFLKCSEQVEHPSFNSERTSIHEAWNILNADKYKGIHRRNLLVFLLGVLNLHFPITKIIKDEREAYESPSEFEPNRSHNPLLTEENDPLSKSLNQSVHAMAPEGQLSREKRTIGYFDDEGNYEIAEDEVRELHNMFEPWYINRLCAGDNLGQFVSRRGGAEAHSFHPEISQVSKDLAQNYREKLLAGTADLIQQNKVVMPKDGKISHADLLIVSKKVVEEKINKFGELVKEEQSKDYTFKPQISPYTPMRGEGSQERKSVYARKEKSMTPEPLGKERVNELYALAKLRADKYDRESEDVEYERNYEECTFQPNKYLKRETPSKNNTSGYFAKGIEKSVERIRNARMEREQQQSASKNTRENYDGQFVCSMDKTMRNTSKDRTPRKEGRSKSPIGNTRGTPVQGRDSGIIRSQSNAGIANMKRDDHNEDNGGYQYYEEKRQHYEGFNYELEEQNQAQRNLAFANEMGRVQQGYAYGDQNQKREPTREITPFMHKDFDSKIDENEDDRVPLLFVDVNLGQGKAERITVFEGDTAEGLAQKFSEEYGLEPLMKAKLKEMLDAQIAGLLSRIEEELHSGYSETERYKNQY